MPTDTLDKMTKDELKQYCRELKTTHERLKHENDVLRERLEIVMQANKSIKEEVAAMRKLLIKLADKLL